MISDFFITTGQGLMVWFLGLFPTDFEVPDWFTGFSGTVTQVLAGANGMGVWIPWVLIFIVVGSTFVLWSAGLVLKAARWLLGLIPTMGGG